MPLTVLKDSDIQELLHDLKLANLENFQKKMREALHEYSTDSDTASTSSSNSNPSTPQGSLTLMDQTGQPFGFLNATETTAFRTALASSLLITPRTKVKTLTVYGAGKQAFWHVRLALILRGHTIKTINVINRSFTDRTRAFLKSFLHIPDHVKEREGWASAKFTILSPAYGEFARLEKDYLRASDIIFLTTPSTTPAFNHQILTNTEGRKKGRLIVAIGSYKPHMIEIPLEVMAQAVKVHGSGHHFHKHAQEGGVIVVDTIDGCKEEAGEIIQSNISAKNLVELGELVMLSHGSDSSSAIDDTDDSPRESLDALRSPRSPTADGASTPTPGSPLLSRSIANVFRDEHTGSTSPSSSRSPSRKSSGSFSFIKSKSRSGSMNSSNPSIATGMLGRDILGEKDDDMSRWLRNGNVIYKSVGMGLMDLVVGTELVRLAREKGVGVNVEGF
ncbi:family decarboxylase protein [Rutstroemia sp. NJR-2017a WRK4]|nr:family decarboxylase protein [Rutstroemia sp. NJR-2017a WRK4]